MATTTVLTDRKVKNIFNNSRQCHCHLWEVSFTGSSTCIRLLSKSFISSSKLNKDRCFSPSIDSWGKQTGRWTTTYKLLLVTLQSEYIHYRLTVPWVFEVNLGYSKIFKWSLIPRSHYLFPNSLLKFWYYSKILKYTVYKMYSSRDMPTSYDRYRAYSKFIVFDLSWLNC